MQRLSCLHVNLSKSDVDSLSEQYPYVSRSDLGVISANHVRLVDQSYLKLITKSCINHR